MKTESTADIIQRLREENKEQQDWRWAQKMARGNTEYPLNEVWFWYALRRNEGWASDPK